jgi:hypothetical protein
MTKLQKVNAEITRDNLIDADVSAVSEEWHNWRKEFTIEMMEKVAEVCGD